MLLSRRSAQRDKALDALEKTCREKRRIAAAKWRQQNPDKARDIALRSKYGITVYEYTAMLEKQNDRCAICGCHSSLSPGKTLVVDHDHSSGKVRGLLCSNCNKGLGNFRDKVVFLNRAAAYLQKENDA